MQVRRQCLRVVLVIMVALVGGLEIVRNIGQETLREWWLLINFRREQSSACHAAQVQGCGMRWLYDQYDSIGVTATCDYVSGECSCDTPQVTSTEVVMPSLTTVLCTSDSHACARACEPAYRGPPSEDQV